MNVCSLPKKAGGTSQAGLSGCHLSSAFPYGVQHRSDSLPQDSFIFDSFESCA